MPWLTAIDESYDFGPHGERKLARFDQAPPKTKKTSLWDAPDVEWAAGSPMPLSRKPVPVYAFPWRIARDIADLITTALQNGPQDPEIAALVPVEQVFLRLHDGQDKIPERPIWLRNLLALRTVWAAWLAERHAPGQDEPWKRHVTLLLPSGQEDGRVARFTMTRPSEASEAVSTAVGRRGHLVAIDREVTRLEPLPPSEAAAVASAGASRGRLVGRADQLVKEVVALLAIRSETPLNALTEDIWTRIDIPPDLDDGASDIPITEALQDRLYASPE